MRRSEGIPNNLGGDPLLTRGCATRLGGGVVCTSTSTLVTVDEDSKCKRKGKEHSPAETRRCYKT